MNCLFCAIVAGEIPAAKVKETANVLAFNDINPQAPTHVLVIPKNHFENAAELSASDSQSLSEIFAVAHEIAQENSLTGYRTVFNTGADVVRAFSMLISTFLAGERCSGLLDRMPLMERIVLTLPADIPSVALTGPNDSYIRALESAFLDVAITVRGNEVILRGSPEGTERVKKLIQNFLTVVRAGQPLSDDAVRRSIAMILGDGNESPAEVLTLNILSNRGKTIRPKTANQKHYVDAIDKHTVTFGIGPAGTGKTYLAMAKAVQALQSKQINRIILTRPAVEAGERLGFLPGTLHEKIDPYLRPLFDALHDMLDPEAIPRLMSSGTIEVAPLAYMRGRTLNDSFIILDEAQNTSPEQMKMFLTRLGFGSKMVVTGDITQIDLPTHQESGLGIVREILDGVADISFMDLTSEDVVRHRLVSEIVDAYGRFDLSTGVNRTGRRVNKPRSLGSDR